MRTRFLWALLGAEIIVLVLVVSCWDKPQRDYRCPCWTVRKTLVECDRPYIRISFWFWKEASS